jgi:uncharacterized FAD-dependent dehydrogenase
LDKQLSLAKILTEKVPENLDNDYEEPTLAAGRDSPEDLGESDVAVVGGGPAGLFAAFRFADFSRLRVTLFDKGRDCRSRVVGRKPPTMCYIPEAHTCVCGNTCNVTSGIGGAGLGSDGKLYFYTNVGAPILEGNASPNAEVALEYVMRLFQDVFSATKIQPRVIVPKSNRNWLVSQLRREGFNYKEYPEIHHIGSENCPRITSELVDMLESKGVEIRHRTTVTDIKLGENHLQLETERTDTGTRGRARARFVILAVGKVGLRWLAGQVARLGLRTVSPEPYLGIRIETTRDVLDQLNCLGGDPKLKLAAPKGTSTKSHCVANGGFVVMCKYDEFNLVDGLSYLNKRSENGSFNVITNVHRLATSEECIALLRKFTNGGRRPPIAQLLGDLRKSEVSDVSSVRSNAIKPTLDYFAPGNIAEMFPGEIVSEILSFLDRLGRVVPGIADEETVVYAPVAEGIMPTICADRYLQTNIPRVFAAGDGAGFSQGIVAAAITGVLAADGIRLAIGRKCDTGKTSVRVERYSR